MVPGGPGDPDRKTSVRRCFRLTPHPEEKDCAERILRWGAAVLLVTVCLLLVGQVALAAMVALVALALLGIGGQEWIDYGSRRRKALPEPTDRAMDDLMSRSVDEVAVRAMDSH